MDSKTYHHGDLRKALLEAATEMISEDGVDSVTIRALAQRVGVSRTAPYRHFKDKDELLTAVAIEGYERLAATMADVRHDQTLDSVARLSRMGEAYVLFAVENATHYRLMVIDSSVQSRSTPAFREAALTARQQLVDIIKEGQQEGFVIDAPPQDIGNLLWSASHGLATLLINGQMRVKNVEATAKFMTEKMCYGLLKQDQETAES
ncbi:MAG: TetR/AcrR family transcriptional regulator [Chloroflexota bacterium]